MRGQRACSEAACQGDGWKSRSGWGGGKERRKERKKEGRKGYRHSLSPAWPGGFWYQAYGNCKSCLRGSAGDSSTSRAEKAAGKPGLPVLFDVGFFQSPSLNVTQLCDPSASATGLLSAWAPAGRGELCPLLLPLPAARCRVLVAAFTRGGSCPGRTG